MLLNIPQVSKGSPATITLSKAELFSVPKVQNDAYFFDQTNVESVISVWESNPGHQKQILKFHLIESQPQAQFSISAKARSSFELKRIILCDYDGGSLSLDRADLPAGLDIQAL